MRILPPFAGTLIDLVLGNRKGQEPKLDPDVQAFRAATGPRLSDLRNNHTSGGEDFLKVMGCGTLLLLIVALVVAIMALWAFVMLFVWGHFIVAGGLLPGAQPITSIFGALIFLLGVAFLGRFGGFIFIAYAIYLALTGASGQTINILDLHLTLTQLVIYGLFLSTFGFGSGSSSSGKSSLRKDKK